MQEIEGYLPLFSGSLFSARHLFGPSVFRKTLFVLAAFLQYDSYSNLSRGWYWVTFLLKQETDCTGKFSPVVSLPRLEPGCGRVPGDFFEPRPKKKTGRWSLRD